MEISIGRGEICTSEFPLLPLQSWMKAAWFLTWYRARRSGNMSAPSQLAQMYSVGVPEILITSGLWQKRENILTVIAAVTVFSASKFPVHCVMDMAIFLIMKTGHWGWVTVVTFLKRWWDIYSPSVRAEIYSERAVALHVSLGDPGPVAQRNALRQPPRASKH